MRRELTCAFAVLLLAAGCGGDGSSGSTGPSTDGPTTTAEEPTGTEFAPERSYRWDVRGESDNTARVTVELGSTVRADEAPPEAFAGLTGVCDVDEQRDAFLPVRMAVRNTTEGFDLAPTLRLRLQNAEDRSQASVAVDAANSFTDGPECDALTSGSIDDGTGVKFKGITPDSENDHDTLLVLHDYFSPSHPEGDDAALREWFGTMFVRDDTSSLRTECFDAPADRYAHTGGLLRLGQVLSPAFPLADSRVDRGQTDEDDPPRCADADPENTAREGREDNAACRELSASSEVTTTTTRLGARRRTFDRAGSVAQVCLGFGVPEELELSPGMQCALVAAAATYAAFPTNQAAKRACDVLGIREELEDGSWAGATSGLACSFFAEAFAGAAGVAAAGASAASGPGAAAVGLGTYKAFSAGLGLACGGLLEGGAEALGEKLEADHQRNVAMDIIREGKCLQRTTLKGLIRWSAAACP